MRQMAIYSRFPSLIPISWWRATRGRDEAAVRRHIEELAAHGIDAPPATPIFWLLPNWLLTLAPATTQVHTAKSSGEVEPVLLRMPDGEVFVTVGSDHTDRDLERSSLLLAKLTCPKTPER